MKLLVIDAVGLRPKDLSLAPHLRALAEEGTMRPLETVFPAVTSTVQASWLTGTPPCQHGIVGNGWYFRDLAQVFMWRQSNHLVQGEKLYESARRRDPSFTCAKLFWWFNMYAPVQFSVTPRPEYHANGLKTPGLYSHPSDLASQLQTRLGAFPLFKFWGPAANLQSTRWIVDCALDVLEEHDPTLMLVYLPHLDYDHQRFGPDAPRAREAVGELDVEASRIIERAREGGADVIVLSEYGVEEVTTPVFINRLLREWGYLQVQETSHGELLDSGASRAFAVADHQVAHVYVPDPSDLATIGKRLQETAGIDRVLDRTAQREWNIDHERSGELVCVSEKGAWFAYPYWLEEKRRPDFATTVDIHRKPGYDPTELFLDPALQFPRLRIALRLAQKTLGFRYLLDVIGTDPSLVRGSHGRLPDNPENGPLFISSRRDRELETISALQVKDEILRRLS